MEADGDGGVSVEAEKNSTPDGEVKIKRKMKTPFQLELLEKTYATETYPSERLREELSVKLGLSDRQLQMWFCHRRLKDRKVPAEKKQKKGGSPSAAAGPSLDELVVSNACVAKERGSGLSLLDNTDLMQHQHRVAHKIGSAVPRMSKELPSMRGLYKPPLAISEQRAIATVEAQLGELLREDGPILGMEFDPLPPGAFGAPIVMSGHLKPPGWSDDTQLHETLDAKAIKRASRALHEYQFLPEKPSIRNGAYDRALQHHYYGSPTDIQNARVPLSTGRSIMHDNEQVPSGYNLQAQMPNLNILPQQGRQGHHLSPAPGEVDIAPRSPLVNVNIDAHHLVHPINGLDNQIITPERRIVHEEERLERKRKTEEARIAKEVEAHEKRIRKELEKQDILRRKREEQIKKEMERQERERRKEEERLLREKQREEERLQREQKREMERREKFLQKEYIRAEKMRLKEVMRREKEVARLRTANYRAAARRIAKESMDLIEDQRLELMELAALCKGLPSILALDSEALQSLDLLKDKLPEWPPKSVHLKIPFTAEPWTDSDENASNLLMAWRFLITFADVLGLWPFTLDEFIQSFNDYDSRLLEEIHMALLRSVIKDIEDVARTAASALFSNQNSAVIPGGGHLQIGEGACDWGFDLLSWQRHLTPLTWPEVLRQFALSAGFGPKLKKQNMEIANLRDDNEDDDGADVISNLRSGVAAENALSIMQERGYSNPRRSRHRLTPGTVKFAAFHVLSLEGSKGLSILEVADKIQKSGLRDLTTSRTPEASISAALSRDTKLFERTAPSTYCVLSPYRKDPADAEAVLSEAREKIRVYQNGNIDRIEARDAEKDDADRDQDSASDVADDLDVDDLDDVSKLNEASYSSERSIFEDKNLSRYGNENQNKLMETLSDALGNSKGSSTSVGKLKSNGASGDLCADVTAVHSHAKVPDQENTIIDEVGSGETWVQGLTEREYANLSIEERLNALVALIGVANEGNALRVALEERLEAANALKKQMWAEAQLDKRRMKEEHILKLHHSSPAVNRAEQTLPHFAVEDRKNPLLSIDMKSESCSTNHSNNIIGEKNPLQEFPVGSDNLLLQQSVYAAEKSRSDLKAYIGHWAELIYVYRSLPLGQDRRYNRYWQFRTSPSQNDPGSGRIFVELCTGIWRLIDSEEGFDALLSSLDVRGFRESHLHSMLQKIELSFKQTSRINNLCTKSGDEVNKELLEVRPKLDSYPSFDCHKNTVHVSYSNSPESSAPFAFEHGKNVSEKNGIMERFKDFEEWIWNACIDLNTLGALKYGRLRSQRLLEICNHCHAVFYCDDYHCLSCHSTYSCSDSTSNFPEHVTQCERKLSEELDGVLVDLSLPPRIRLLKVHLATIEAYIPSEALESVWSDDYRKSWGLRLHMATTAEELLQALTLLEHSIKRDFLSENYETTHEVLGSCRNTGRDADMSCIPEEEISVLSWIPVTTPAVALRLMELDTSIYYTLDQKDARQKDNEDGYFSKLSSRYSALRSSIHNISKAGCLQPDSSLVDLRSGHASLKRGRGRPRGPSRKSQRRAINSQDELCQETPKKYKFGCRRGGRKKARHSTRNKPKYAKRAEKNVVEKRVMEDILFDNSPEPQQEKSNLEEMPVEVEDAENISSSEMSEFGNDNGRASADEYDDLLVDDFSGVERVRSPIFAGSGDYGLEEDDNYDNNDNDEDEGEDGPADYHIDEYFNNDYREEGDQLAGGDRFRNLDGSLDRGSVSSSSEYSY